MDLEGDGGEVERGDEGRASNRTLELVLSTPVRPNPEEEGTTSTSGSSSSSSSSVHLRCLLKIFPRESLEDFRWACGSSSSSSKKEPEGEETVELRDNSGVLSREGGERDNRVGDWWILIWGMESGEGGVNDDSVESKEALPVVVVLEFETEGYPNDRYRVLFFFPPNAYSFSSQSS